MVIRMNKKYTALVLWEGGDIPGEKEEVDAELHAFETPREAIERVLRSDYEPGWKILEIQLHQPEFGIYG